MPLGVVLGFGVGQFSGKARDYREISVCQRTYILQNDRASGEDAFSSAKIPPLEMPKLDRVRPSPLSSHFIAIGQPFGRSGQAPGHPSVSCPFDVGVAVDIFVGIRYLSSFFDKRISRPFLRDNLSKVVLLH